MKIFSGFINRKDNNLRSRLALDWKLDKITPGLSINSFIRSKFSSELSWNALQQTEVMLSHLVSN